MTVKISDDDDGDDDAKHARRDASRFDAAVTARAELQDRARRALPKDYDFACKKDREIHEAVLAKVYDNELKLADKSDAYVRGRYEYAVETGRLDAADTPPSADAEEWRGQRPMWQTPLAVTGRVDASEDADAEARKQDVLGRNPWLAPLRAHRDD